MRVLIFFIPFLLFAKAIVVAAAANVNYALDALIKDFNSLYPQIHIRKVIASSGKLTSQIEKGAPYDIFLSADMKYPEYLYKKGKTFTKPLIYAVGKLIFFSKKKVSLKDLNNLKIAIANPKTAPYGKAAIEVINNLKIKPNLVYADSVAGAYFYALHAVDGAFLPLSAVISKKGYIINIPQNLYSPIKQGVVIIKPSLEVSAFFGYLFSKRAIKILKKYGYSD